MNILITSVGTQNKIVKYFKEKLKNNGKVIVTDMSDLAPAIYEADKYYIVPPINDPKYIEKLLEICKSEEINAIFSLIDPELSIISKNKDKFLKINVIPVISEYDAVELGFDKYNMYQYLIENGFKTLKTYVNKEDFFRDYNIHKIDFPVFLKPRKGSASLNTFKVDSKESLEEVLNSFPELIIQEFAKGQEIGADVYIDPFSKKVVSIFTKEKVKMKAGETNKARSFKSPELFQLIKDFAEKVGYKYMIDIDLFKVNGEYYISDVNPRFGGGYPHAFESGVDFPELIINSLNGIENKENIGNYKENIYMMKYPELRIINANMEE